MDVFFEIHQGLERESPGGAAYTHQAFQMLPTLIQPSILDIGCGPGSQTFELAKLTDGQIIAIDTHQPFLDHLASKAKLVGLQDRIQCLNQSMLELSFPDTFFDLIWAEASIYCMGFETGLKQWYGLLKPGGHLVVSELVWLQPDPPQEVQRFWQEAYPDMQSLETLLHLIPACNYNIVGHFTLPPEAWWAYYQPLEARLDQLASKYTQPPDSLVLAVERQEIQMYRQYSDWYGYEFFVLGK